MEAAVWAWGWLLAARPDLTVLVHTKLTDAWCWTVEQRMGLFSGMGPPPDCTSCCLSHRDPDTKRPPSPLNMEKADPASAKQPQRRATPTPHRLWLDFLVERFEVINRLLFTLSLPNWTKP
jgi:hypothetical protein